MEPDRFSRSGLLRAARTGPALLTVTAVLLMFLLARRLLGTAAGLSAAVLLGLHPTFALLARQAADAGPTLALGLGAVLVAARIAGSLARGGQPWLATWTGLTLLAGAALAAGTTAPPYLIGAAALVLTGLLAAQLHRRAVALAALPAVPSLRLSSQLTSPGPRSAPDSLPGAPAPPPDLVTVAGTAVVSAVAAVLIGVAVSPALWGWLPERLATREEQRPALVAAGVLAPAGHRSVTDLLTDPFITPPRQVALLPARLASPMLSTALAPSTDLVPSSDAVTSLDLVTSPNVVPSVDPGVVESGASVEPASVVPGQAGDAEQMERTTGYSRSLWAGLPLGERGDQASVRSIMIGCGAVLTAAAGLGWIVLWRRSRLPALAVAGWLLAAVGWHVLTPPGQAADRALPLVAVACLLAGGGLAQFAVVLAHRFHPTTEGEPVCRSTSAWGGADEVGDDRGGQADER